MDETRSIAPSTSALTHNRTEPLDWDSVQQLPDDRDERTTLRYQLDVDLLAQYRDWLSIVGLPEQPDSFDKFLIDYSGEHHGSRLFCSDYVGQRLIEWQYMDMQNGVDKLKRFFAKVVKGARVIRNEATGSIGIVELTRRKALEKECKLLREQMTTLGTTQKRRPEFKDAVQIVENEEDQSVFWLVRRSLPSLKDFHAKDPETVEHFFVFRSPGIGPADFVFAWQAFEKSRSVKGLRNLVTKQKRRNV